MDRARFEVEPNGWFGRAGRSAPTVLQSCVLLTPMSVSARDVPGDAIQLRSVMERIRISSDVRSHASMRTLDIVAPYFICSRIDRTSRPNKVDLKHWCALRRSALDSLLGTQRN